MNEEDAEAMARAINAASFAAANVVYDYAAKFSKREDYRPLELLAKRVQEAAVKAGAKAAEW